MSGRTRLDPALLLFGVFLLAVPWGETGFGLLPAGFSVTKAAFVLFVLAILVARPVSSLPGLLRASDLWLAVLLAGGALSLTVSALPGASLVSLFRLLAMALLFLLSRSCLDSEAGRRTAVTALALGGTGQAILGIAQSLASTTWFGWGIYPPYQSLVPVESAADPDLVLLYRAAGSFPHPNELGLFLVVTIAVTLGGLPRLPRVPRLLAAGAALIQTTGLLYTCSRSAWLGLLAAGGILAARSPARRWILATLLLGLAAGVILLPAGGREALLARSSRLQPYEASRLHYFRAAARMALSHPLTGIGLGTYAERFDEFKDPGIEPDREQSSDAHNAFLALAAEAGIPAGLALLAGFLAGLAAGARTLLRPGPLPSAMLTPAAALAGAIFPLLLNGYQYQEAAWLALAWSGSAAALTRRQGRGGPVLRRGLPLRLVLAAAVLTSLPLFALVARRGGVEPTLSGRTLLLESTPLGMRPRERPRIHIDRSRLTELRLLAGTDPERFLGLRDWTASPDRSLDAARSGSDLRLLARTIPPFALSRLLHGRASDLEEVRARVALLASAWRPNLDDLHLAEGIYALSLAADWLSDDLAPGERGRMLEMIRLGATSLRQTLRLYPPLNNHRAVGAACLGIAGMSCYGDLPEAAGWIRQSLRDLELCARHLSDDGISPEGAGYAGYLLEYLLKFDDAAGTLLGTPPLAEGWQKAFPAAFLHQAIPSAFWSRDNLALSFGDSPRAPWYGPGYLAARLAARHADPLAAWIAAESRARSVDSPETAAWLDLLWRGDLPAPAGPSSLPTWACYDNWGLCLTRDSWAGDATLLGFTCPPAGGRRLRRGGFAYPGLGHAHPDAASFVLFSRGEHLVAHPGPTLVKLTADHNTILVNGRGQLGEGGAWLEGRKLFRRSRTPDLIRAEHTEGYDYLAGDAAPAYDSRGLRRFERHLMWARPGVICMLDDLESEQLSSFEWLLHTEGTVEGLDARSVRVNRGRAALLVRVLWPENASLTWSGEEETAGGAAPWGIKSWRTLRIGTPEAVTAARFLVLMLPVAAGAPSEFPLSRTWEDRALIDVPPGSGGGRIRVDPAAAGGPPLAFETRP